MPSVAALAMGRGWIVVWTAVTFPRYILGQQFDLSGTKVGSEFIVTDDLLSGDVVLGAKVVGLSNGGFAVSWRRASAQHSASVRSVLVRRYTTSGAPQAMSPTITPTATTPRPTPKIAVVESSTTFTAAPIQGSKITTGRAVAMSVTTQEAAEQETQRERTESWSTTRSASTTTKINEEEKERPNTNLYLFVAIGVAGVSCLFCAVGCILFFVYARQQKRRNKEMTQMLSNTMRMLESNGGTVSIPSLRYSSVGELAQPAENEQCHYNNVSPEDRSLRVSLTGYMGVGQLAAENQSVPPPYDHPTSTLYH